MPLRGNPQSSDSTSSSVLPCSFALSPPQVHDDALKAFAAANSCAKEEMGGSQPGSVSVTA